MPADPLAVTMAAPEAADERTVVGARYELIALLGAGGMGNVYKARDLELDEVVALKILRRDVAFAPGALDRFRREVKLARRVTHPSVARVFDIGELGDEKILTMELIDGEPLSALIEREGTLGLARTLEIAASICAGVGAAHAAGVVHRDLKPDNVMMAKDGRVVVTDFGIARAAATDVAKTAGFVGTPAYMAPEQVEGTDIDERADVFAFGAMLFEMLTGVHPWRGDSPIVVAAARLIHPAPDPRSLRPDLPSRLAELVLRCLARNRNDRPGTMADINAVLATITEPRETRSVRPPRPEPGLALSSSDKRVAVLPFVNVGSVEHEWVADGLTDDLIDALSIARGLRVCSRGVVRGYKNVERDARQIGRDLDVQVVVDGSVRKTPGAFRISARLVSVADGMQLWAKRFDGAETDMLTLNDDVAHAVADALTADLGIAAGRAMDAEATELYFRARLAYHGELFPAGNAAALFERVLERAPDDARVIAGYVMSQAPHQRDTTRLRELAERALRLAPSLPDPHVALGALAFHAMQPVEAIRSLRRALRIASNSAEVHDMLGIILEFADGPEAVRHLETALSLEPVSPRVRINLMRHYALAGDWDRVEVTAAASKTPAVGSQNTRLIMWRRDVKAAEALRATFDDASQSFFVITQRMMLDLVLGKPVPSGEWFHAPTTGRWMQCLVAEFSAEGAAVRNDVPRALAAIEHAEQLGVFDIAWLDRCPLFDDLRSEPRFKQSRVRIAERAAAARAAYASSEL